MTRIVAAAAIAALACPATAAAQGFSLGATGGIGVSKLVGFSVEDQVESRTGATIGGFVTYETAGPVSFQVEALYVQKGADYTASSARGEGELKLAYLEVPVFLRFELPVLRNASPVLYGGPAFSFELSCEFAEGTGAAEDCDVSGAAPERRDTDVGVAFGGSLGFPVGRATLRGDLRFNQSIRSVVTDAGSSSIRNEAILFLVGVSFPVGR